MSNKVRVAIVLPYFGPGGADKMVFQLASGMNAEKFETEVFCVYGQPQGNYMEQALKVQGVRIHYIGKKLGPSLGAIRRLFRELDSFSPDVVHTHMYACVYSALWPVVRKKPFLHTFHTLPEVENQRFVRRLLTKYLVSQKKMTPVAISKSNQRMVADYYGISPEDVHMVHNPVDIRRFASESGKDDSIFRFITVGRFSPEKNQQMMYLAFASFLEQGYDARLLMLGKGEEEAALKTLAEELNISNKIDYAGYVDNVEDYLKAADVFLLSSHYEAQPLCLLEAMAAGLPVISTNVGGVPDIVTDNGILIHKGDTEAMTQAMERLYLEQELRRKMSEASVSNAAQFDVSNTVAGYSELYRRCAGKK